jgi:hypothetical protein
MVTARAIYSIHAADEDIPRAWAMYFGGSGPEGGKAVASDAAGNAYILTTIGSRDAPGVPSPGTYLLKFNAAGVLQYAAAIGANGQDVAIGPDGAAYVLASRLVFGDVFVARVSVSGSIVNTTNVPGLTMERL